MNGREFRPYLRIIMKGETKPTFAHRANRDGTFDSICRDCFVTVPTLQREEDLEKPEGEHVCDPSTLERFKSAK